MTTIALDTHKTIQKLQAKGFTPEQAEGIVETLTESSLVTKTDLQLTAKDLKVWVALMLLAQGALVVTLQNLFAG